MLIGYDVAGEPDSAVVAYFNGPEPAGGGGLVLNVSVSDALDAVAFGLEDGESSDPFEFFRIWTDERSINDDDMDIPHAIEARLAFDMPDSAVVVSGMTSGYVAFFGFVQGGVVQWQDADPVIAQAGGYEVTFDVTLSDETFNTGIFWSTCPGPCAGATVKATVTQIGSQPIQAVPPVPDGGATVALLGATLCGLGVLRRRVR